MKLVITGGRDYDDSAMLFDTLTLLKPTRIYVGDAKGADFLANEWCLNNDVPCHMFKADWDTNGKSAGPSRNRRMLDFALEDGTFLDVLVLAFPGGKGTNDCVKAAVERNMIVLRVEA